MGYFSEEDAVKQERILRENEDYTAPATRSGTVAKAKYVNVRLGPSNTAESIGQLTMGDHVEIIGQERDYYKIPFKGCEAYVAAHFIEED